jgi:hypothetical protein
MTLGDLLELLRESILNDRSDRASGTPDYLWTDKTLVTYINEAQRKFAVEGLVLRDAQTDEVTKITLVEGQTLYPLHESVIAVLSLKNANQEADLTRVGHSTFGAYRAPTDSWVDPAGYTSLPAGPSLAYATDGGLSDAADGTLSQVVMRVYPTPAAVQDGQVLRLRVIRKPIEKLVVTGLSASPEIPEDHHIEMLDWAAYLALRIIDDDAGARKAAFEFKATFEESVKDARMLVMRKLFAPMDWGFGRGGFSWGSSNA